MIHLFQMLIPSLLWLTLCKASSKETYLAHMKNLEDLLGDQHWNVKAYVIDLYQHYYPHADAFSHTRKDGKNEKFVECFSEIGSASDEMWRTFVDHWNITDENHWLVIKTVQGARLLLCLNTDFFNEYKTHAKSWYANILSDKEIISNGKNTRNLVHCEKKISEQIEEMISRVASEFAYDKQKEDLAVLYSIGRYMCHVNEQHERLKNIKYGDVKNIFERKEEVIKEFAKRIKKVSDGASSYNGCIRETEKLALDYGYGESYQKYVFLRKYHLVSFLETLYLTECENKFPKGEL